MTSNIGSELLLEGMTSQRGIEPDNREGVLRALQTHFRPEFLNRVDDIVLFKPLTRAELEQIVNLMFDDLRERLAEQRMTLEVSPETRGS